MAYSDQDYCSDYNEDDDGDYYGDSDHGDDVVFGNFDSDSNEEEENYYDILKEEDIRQLMEDDVSKVRATLSLPTRGHARVLLLAHNWSVSNALDQWFADEEKVRKALGLLTSSQMKIRASKNQKFCCEICGDDYPFTKNHAASCGCGHIYCVECFKSWIGSLINDGPGCITRLRCPGINCNAVVLEEIVESIAGEDDITNYRRYILRSYVEQSNHQVIKWCPGPGCDFAVKKLNTCTEKYEVVCECLHAFCWNCSEDSHRPVDCATVARWMRKNKSEGLNTLWIKANSKSCPKCKRPIQKIDGCMHMTCSAPCSYEFCWMCLKDWKNHSDYYRCNRYEKRMRKGELKEEETKRKEAKKEWDRYVHYYERWQGNENSRKKAIRDLIQLRDNDIQTLSKAQCETIGQLKFIIEAWEQIVECRGVLKWTYAYGYYMPTKSNSASRKLFEYSQGEAEHVLEKLHQCAEREMMAFLLETKPWEEFKSFSHKLKHLTCVTKEFFNKLIVELEKEEDPRPLLNSDQPKKTTPSDSLAKPSKSNKRLSRKNRKNSRVWFK